MSNLQTYQVLSGTYTQVIDGTEITAIAGTSSDLVKLTPKTARRLGANFVLVEGEDRGTLGTEVAIQEFLAHSLEEIEQALTTVHDPVLLGKMYEVEKGNQGRNEVLEAIDSRYDEVSEEHSRA